MSSNERARYWPRSFFGGLPCELFGELVQRADAHGREDPVDARAHPELGFNAQLGTATYEMQKGFDADRVDERHASAVEADLGIRVVEAGFHEPADLLGAGHVELAAEADHQAAPNLDAGYRK